MIIEIGLIISFVFLSEENSCLLSVSNESITRQNASVTLPIDLYALLLITLRLSELEKRFFPVSNSSWLTLMCMQTIQSKKETNYQSYNYCCLFCSSMVCVIVFREEENYRSHKRRYPILIVEQFSSMPITRRFWREEEKIGRLFSTSFVCVQTRHTRRRNISCRAKNHTLYSLSLGKEDAFVSNDIRLCHISNKVMYKNLPKYSDFSSTFIYLSRVGELKSIID